MCVTGSPRAHAFALPPRTDYLKLPAATKDEGGAYVSRKLRIPLAQLVALRAAVINSAVRAYKPHMILVDHAPLGMAGELLGTLRQVKREQPQTRIVLGLRDIYDDGPLVRHAWARAGVPAILEEIYDRILVYGQPDVFDVVSEYGLTASVARKLTYTGYIYRSDLGSAAAPCRDAGEEPLVLVTVGGGGDGFPIILNYFEGLAAAGGVPWRSMVVLGPLMERARKRAAKAAAQGLPGVSVLEFTPRLRDYVAQASVVLTMGGYNTVLEALALRKRLVVVPRVAPRKEQLVRAERFARRGLIRWLDPRRAFQPANLIEAVRDTLAAPAPPDGVLDLEGLARTVRTLKESLDGTAETRADARKPSAEIAGSRDDAVPRQAAAT
jgi:predicted glycosyltransferase